MHEIYYMCLICHYSYIEQIPYFSPYIIIATEFNNLLDWARVKAQTPLLRFLVDQQIHSKHVELTRRRACCADHKIRRHRRCRTLDL